MNRSSVCPLLILAACACMLPGLNAQSTKDESKNVTASFYSTRYNGRRTASGERFNSNSLTAAHRELPFGTKVRLTNVNNQKSVVVRVNDRGPNIKGREISVTRRAARQLGFLKAGTSSVTMTVLQPAK